MKFVLLVVVCCNLPQLSPAEYFWRDYNGTIPEDALPGGRTPNQTTYIGAIAVLPYCISSTPDIVSATIYPGDLFGYAAYRVDVYINDKGVKILCSPSHDRFKWVQTVPNDCSLVQGSYASYLHENTTNFIGRASYEGHYVMGRFSTSERHMSASWLGPLRIHLHLESFEKLVYC